MRLRDIAARLGITERSAYGIVTDLAQAGYVVKQKDGRAALAMPGLVPAVRADRAGFHDPPSPCPAPAVPPAAASRAGSRSAANTFCIMCQSCG
jgi:hypothetical protein